MTSHKQDSWFSRYSTLALGVVAVEVGMTALGALTRTLAREITLRRVAPAGGHPHKPALVPDSSPLPETARHPRPKETRTAAKPPPTYDPAYEAAMAASKAAELRAWTERLHQPW